MSPVTATVALPLSLVASSASRRPRRTTTVTTSTDRKQKNNSIGFGGKKKEMLWHCVEGCGACCKLQKGPSFPSPEEIFTDPSDIELYKSLIGPDGWCIHYEKSTRKCSIYSERPYFCRVEPQVFESLYGIEEKKFNKEACRIIPLGVNTDILEAKSSIIGSCRDTIKAIYGPNSKELYNFDKSIRSSSN